MRVTAKAHRGNKILEILLPCLLLIATIIYFIIVEPVGIFALIFTAIFCCAIWPLFYLMAYLRFKRLVRKIKDALKVE